MSEGAFLTLCLILRCLPIRLKATTRIWCFAVALHSSPLGLHSNPLAIRSKPLVVRSSPLALLSSPLALLSGSLILLSGSLALLSRPPTLRSSPLRYFLFMLYILQLRCSELVFRAKMSIHVHCFDELIRFRDVIKSKLANLILSQSMVGSCHLKETTNTTTRPKATEVFTSKF